jgi:TPP-dependent trihydroxycyclohexane-1,2-dione (THcHDO) dehydratase
MKELKYRPLGKTFLVEFRDRVKEAEAKNNITLVGVNGAAPSVEIEYDGDLVVSVGNGIEDFKPGDTVMLKLQHISQGKTVKIEDKIYVLYSEYDVAVVRDDIRNKFLPNLSNQLIN